MQESILGHRLGYLVGGADEAPFSSGARPRRPPAGLGGQPAGWQQLAACRGRDLEGFFPGKEKPAPPAWLVELCDRCPVQQECLATAVGSEAVGYWAGLTTRQRQLLKS